MKSEKIILLFLFFFSLQSCGGEDNDDYITIDIEKNDTVSNDNDGNDNDGNDNDGNDNDRNDNDRNDNDRNDNDGNDNDGNDNSGNEGDDGDNSPSPTGILTSTKAYLYIDRISGDSFSHQSAACFGDYAFFFSVRMAKVMVFNMRTNQSIFTLEQNDLGSTSVYHCNQACFGAQKYSEEDPFPLLYISQRQDKSKRCFITVFRVLPTYSGIEQEYTAFAFELIQTIYLPVATDNNSLNNANAVIDTSNRYIYTYSRNNNSSAENYGKCKITKFNLPNALESTSIMLSDEDILDSYFIGTSAINMQGGAYHNGLLYIGRGLPSVGYVNLYVVDIANRKLWFTVDLLNNGFNYEPEGAFIYNDVLYIGASRFIFRFSFKYENSSAKAMAIPFEVTD